MCDFVCRCDFSGPGVCANCMNETPGHYSPALHNFNWQKHGCAIGSPVSSIVANIYMEEMESRASADTRENNHQTGSDTWMTPGSKANLGSWGIHWSHQLSGQKQQVHWRGSQEYVGLTGPCCTLRESRHTEYYLQFNSHHLLEHKLSVIKSLSYSLASKKQLKLIKI